MTLAFLSPMVLLGTLLVAVPVIIHLVMRKKPKLLVFPALQFLQQRRKTNLRKLRLRHLLLLALRILMILLIALALARPLASNIPGELVVGSPLGVVMVFDTSLSMDYKIEGKTRLDQAKEQAQAFLKTLPGGSEVAVVDTAESSVGRFGTVNEAVKLIDNRKLSARNRPLTTGLEDALRLLERSAPNLPILLCVFSDRTNASWDANAVGATLLPQRQAVEAKLKRTLNVVYYDLGPQEPRNLCITGLSVRPASISVATALEDLRFGVATNELLQIVATVQSTNLAVNNEALLFIDGKPNPVGRVAVNFTGSKTQMETKTITFPPFELKDPVVQGRVVLASPDALESDNTRYWTLVAPQRRVLVLADELADAQDWRIALESLNILPMRGEVKKPADCPPGLTPDDYQAVCLFGVRQPSQQLWEILQRYVTMGGGLVIVPGVNLDAKSYTTPTALELMPGKPTEPKSIPLPGVPLELGNYDHPALSNFKRWQRDISDFTVTRYWQLEPVANQTNTIAPLRLEQSPVLWAERQFDRNKIGGRVVWFGTVMYSRPDDPAWKDWNNFQTGWLYVGLAHTCVSHVIGAREQRANFTIGDDVRFHLPRNNRLQEYTLRGPATSSGKIQAGQASLAVPEANKPGNYLASDPAGVLWSRSFSINTMPAETQLAADRPTAEALGRFFGAEGLAKAGEERQLGDLVKDAMGMSPQSELLPYLMLLLLVVLAGENFLANRFYRPEPSAE
jgi:hypothetical protein